MNDIVVKATPFQIYRQIPLNRVLFLAGADLNSETKLWTFPNGVSFKVEGQFGSESWENLSNQEKGRGSIDLAKHIQGDDSPGKALTFLKEMFPFAVQQMPDWVLTLEPNPALPKKAAEQKAAAPQPKESHTPPATPSYSTSLFQIYRQIPLSRVFATLEATPDEKGNWVLPEGGDVYSFSGEFGNESWENITRGTKGFGTIDFVKEILPEGTPKASLVWLQTKFPFVLSQMPESVLNPAPRVSNENTAPKPTSNKPPQSSYDQSDVSALSREYTSSELFRAYRHVPLAKVLSALGGKASDVDSEWVMRDGAKVSISGQFGSETWTWGEKNGRGALELVTFAKNHKSVGFSLNWLKNSFPYTPEQVPPSYLNAPVQATENRAVRKKELTEEEKAEIQKKRDAQEEKSAGFAKRKELEDRLNCIDLEHVFPLLGGHTHGADASKWHIPTVGTFIVKDNRWQNVHTQVDKGFGGIPLAAHALGSRDDFNVGLKWMIENFGEDVDQSLIADIDFNKKKKEFTPPERFDETLPEIRRYLCDDRGIPSELLESLIEDGSVYGSFPWYEKESRYLNNVTRCVFLGDASAEIRDTDPNGMKACCDGSETDLSGFSVRPQLEVAENIVSLQEAAIDALSYAAMFPGRFVISTNGAGRFLLQFRVACEAIDLGLGVRASFDADGPGDSAAQKVFAALYACEALSRRFKVPVETVQQWFLEESITVVPSDSPHQTFFAKGETQLKDEYEVFEPIEDGVNEEGIVKMKWKPTGKTSPALIDISVLKMVHPELKRGRVSLKVSQAGVDYIVNELDFARERPVFTKDWNEDFKSMGKKYSNAYDQAFRKRFADGVPALPIELDKFRTAAYQSHQHPEKPKKAVSNPEGEVTSVAANKEEPIAEPLAPSSRPSALRRP